MARKEKVPQREMEVGRRLKAFREGTKIARTAFALSAGLSPQRLITYESGIVPLPYAAFRALNRHFFVSPKWLVTGVPPVSLGRPLEDDEIIAKIDDRALLTAVYDDLLATWLAERQERANAVFFGPDGIVRGLERVMEIFSDWQSATEVPETERMALLQVLEAALAAMDVSKEQDQRTAHALDNPPKRRPAKS